MITAGVTIQSPQVCDRGGNGMGWCDGGGTGMERGCAIV